MSEEFMTVCQVARLLCVAPASVRRWISRGQLPALRRGRTYLVRRADALAVLESVETCRAANLKTSLPVRPAALSPHERAVLARAGLLRFCPGES